eukprot:COSAG01_NODE_27970_length_672_cov_1.382199_1_plen_138_part_10
MYAVDYGSSRNPLYIVVAEGAACCFASPPTSRSQSMGEDFHDDMDDDFWMAAANSVPQSTIAEPATTSVPTLLPQPPQQQQPAQRQQQQQWHRQPQDHLSEPSQSHRPTQLHPPAHSASSGAAAVATRTSTVSAAGLS